MENDLRYEFRTARDILTDLLLNGQATSFPITDQPVSAEQGTVMYDNPATVIIGFSQTDVRYVVYDDSQAKMSAVVEGNGGELRLETVQLTKQDHTFNILATKKVSGNKRQLLQTTTVKVGARLNLPVTPEKEFFEYGSAATVIIGDAQNGAVYQLFNLDDQPISAAASSGSSGDLALVTTDGVTEDITVKVRVTNTKTGLTGILETQPVLKVAPNTLLHAALKEPVTDYNGTATVLLTNSQETVTYQLLFDDIDDDNPEKKLPAGTAIGRAKKGTGKTIELPVKPVFEDLTVSILATKTATGISVVLKEKIVIPVRPDPDKILSVVEETVDPVIGATIRVSQTQKGILYQLRTGAADTPVGRPEYHHKNYGIGKARIGVEFALDEFTSDAVYLPTEPLTRTTTFSVLAIKATTRHSVVIGTITVNIKEPT